MLQAYGADEDKQFGLEGEGLGNVLSARRFVGWYNGLPRDANLPVNLDVEEVVVLGQGNVALDVARIILTPVDILKVRYCVSPYISFTEKAIKLNEGTSGRKE